MRLKIKTFYWALYDFANSLVHVTFLFYFSQWLVIDQGNPGWWYNGALVVSSALFILSVPRFSRDIDATGRKIGGLRLWTVLALVALGATALVAVLSDSHDLLALGLYTAGLYAYLMSFMYFTPMLNDLSSVESRGRVSGFGQGFNSLGQVAALLITLPFVNGAITFVGEPGRAQALLPAVAGFALLSLPMLIWYRDPESRQREEGSASPTLREQIGTILLYKPLLFVLLAYFLFSDALLTFANNFSLYLEVVHQAGDTLKALLSVAILALAAVGGFGFGFVADKYGGKRTLMGVLLAWCFLLAAMAYVTDFRTLVPIFLVAGILFGPVWAVSRSLVGQLAPPHLTASSFSYYVVAERFATFIGPLIWSGALILYGEGAAGYQAALVALSVLVVASLFVLRRAKV